MFCRGFGGYGFGNGGSFGSYGPVGPFSSGWMLLAMGIRFLIIVGIVIFAIKLISKHTKRANDPMRILNEKLASGEITPEDYLKRKDILNNKN